MYPHICHVFIDGAYLRVEAESRWNTADVNALNLANKLMDSTAVQTWAYDRSRHPNALLGRITYYDARPGEDEEAVREAYWRAIELLPDVHLG